METTKRFVTSRDGTRIGYRELGRGAGLVIVHGSMSTGYNHMQLAQALSDGFTVYLPDRRSRASSGPYREGDTIENEVRDLEAMLTATGAHDIAGVSLGAVICLEAALALPTVGRVALYEPPLRMPQAEAVLRRFDAELGSGNIPAALVTAMKGSQMGPRLFDLLPRWLLERMTKQMIDSMEKKGSGEYESFGALAPTLHYETVEIIAAAAGIHRYRAIQNEVLLLGGSKSAAHFRSALDALGEILPNAHRKELPGLNHAATWNRDVGGKPRRVEPELRAFFGRSRVDQPGFTGPFPVRV